MNLSKIGEFDFIERIASRFQSKNISLIKGIGDDTAVFQTTENHFSLLTIDSLVENVHFKLDYTPLDSLGWKSLAVNISDIAAMGGLPKFAVISLSVPPKISIEQLETFYDGLHEATNTYKVNLIGGDTTRSPEHLVISIALFGEVDPDCLLKRAGANIGDQIYVTGKLGGAHAGLMCLLNSLEASDRKLIERHFRPIPLIDQSQALAKTGHITAMIDISDGLASDLGHICGESRVGAILFENKIPLEDGVKSTAKYFDENPLDYALTGGEDYELLFTVQPEYTGKLEKLFPSIYRIGEIVDTGQGMILQYENGKTETLKQSGFDHFKAKI